MKYEETPVKNTKLTHKDVALKTLEVVGTGTVMWFLVKRHKFALVTTWAFIITLFYIAPFVPDLIISAIK